MTIKLIKKVKEDNSNLKSEIKNLKENNKKTEAKKDELELDKRSLLREIQTLTKQSSLLIDDINQAYKTNNHLTDKINHSDKKNNSLTLEKQQLEKEIMLLLENPPLVKELTSSKLKKLSQLNSELHENISNFKQALPMTQLLIPIKYQKMKMKHKALYAENQSLGQQCSTDKLLLLALELMDNFMIPDPPSSRPIQMQ